MCGGAVSSFYDMTSSFASTLMRKRMLVVLLEFCSCCRFGFCTVCLFLAVPCISLLSVIIAYARVLFVRSFVRSFVCLFVCVKSSIMTLY